MLGAVLVKNYYGAPSLYILSDLMRLFKTI